MMGGTRRDSQDGRSVHTIYHETKSCAFAVTYSPCKNSHGNARGSAQPRCRVRFVKETLYKHRLLCAFEQKSSQSSGEASVRV